MSINADGYLLDEEEDDAILISRAQLAAIHRLADAARQAATCPRLPADQRRQLRQAADEVAEA